MCINSWNKIVPQFDTYIGMPSLSVKFYVCGGLSDDGPIDLCLCGVFVVVLFCFFAFCFVFETGSLYIALAVLVVLAALCRPGWPAS